MGSWRRISFLIVLCTFLSGCATYRTVAVPDPLSAGEAPATADPTGDELKVGGEARVTLHSGQVETGRIYALTATDITLGKPSNYGLKKTTLAFADIATIEVPHTPKLASALLTMTGITAIVLTVAIVILAAAIGQGDMSGLS